MEDVTYSTMLHAYSQKKKTWNLEFFFSFFFQVCLWQYRINHIFYSIITLKLYHFHSHHCKESMQEVCNMHLQLKFHVQLMGESFFLSMHVTVLKKSHVSSYMCSITFNITGAFSNWAFCKLKNLLLRKQFLRKTLTSSQASLYWYASWNAENTIGGRVCFILFSPPLPKCFLAVLSICQ